MSDEPILGIDRARVLRLVAWGALVGVLVGVCCTWVSVGDTTLSGIEGPNDGWLVAIVAAISFVWVRSMGRGAWIGIIGMLGASAVIVWTALEDAHDARLVLGASVEYGLVLVVIAGFVLGATGVVAGVRAVRRT